MSTERPDHEATDPAEDGAGTAKPRRRHSPVAVASVAAAVLLVGGGGAYMATTAFDGGGHSGAESPGGDGTPPPLALDGGTGGGGTGGVAPGEPDPYGTVYRADGKLPDGPDSAPVYAAKGSVTAAEVTRLAEALGLTGTPRLVGDTWQAGGGGDGSGPSLQVNRRAPGTWTFSRYAPGTDNCKGAVCTSDPGSPSSHAVSEAAAKKAAAPVLKALGENDAKLDASALMGAVRVVNADPEVGGLPTHGWTTGVQVDKEGQVVGGNGLLKTPERGDTYPVISARGTLDLMNGPDSAPAPGGARNGPGGCASAVPLKDRDEKPCAASTALPRRDSVTVEKATFGLASHFVDGHQTLVPSWLFEVRPKGATASLTVTHPAVDPKYLAAPETPGAPSPRPTGEPASRDVTVQGYTADGKDLTVSFTGGVCADYAVSASENADKVTVKVTETPWQGKVCILIAKVYEKTVRLDEPLGGRKVVGSDGGEIREGKTPGASTMTPTKPTAPRAPRVPHTPEPLAR
ncbi:hypothetical protein OHB41_15135 [Streptomyces sp. NBC_01571]|uniref:hypothetical protein n=1 Tax=Streptomyces sp. NBC_01571 TaxID=2975883 RepID=UPI002255FD6A|nr:hypothetical protein [Streptomyces sp. NBC_01571]MCX4574500.1 hypothetical protein [Streptomyces sp. NBC_01571]